MERWKWASVNCLIRWRNFHLFWQHLEELLFDKSLFVWHHFRTKVFNRHNIHPIPCINIMHTKIVFIAWVNDVRDKIETIQTYSPLDPLWKLWISNKSPSVVHNFCNIRGNVKYYSLLVIVLILSRKVFGNCKLFRNKTIDSTKTNIILYGRFVSCIPRNKRRAYKSLRFTK